MIDRLICQVAGCQMGQAGLALREGVALAGLQLAPECQGPCFALGRFWAVKEGC